MSKKIKRYTLVVSEGIETRILPSLEDVNELFKTINTYNSKKSNPCFCGKFHIVKQNGKYVLSFVKYVKITEPHTLEGIDALTLEFTSPLEIKRQCNIKNNKPLEIALRHNGDINTLPVLYKKDKKYFDDNYLKSLFIKRCLEGDFISELYSDEYITKCNRYDIFDALDKLLGKSEQIKYGLPKEWIISTSSRAYTALTRKEDGTVDYRLKRYLIGKLRSYEIMDRIDNEIEQTKNEVDENVQLTFFNKYKK